jgi:thiamine pyrophosphate-dependent acetolactate synthase large subunit-like protein
MLHSLKATAALMTLGVAAFSSPSYAAKLTAADRAWIDTCIAQRKASKEAPARLSRWFRKGLNPSYTAHAMWWALHRARAFARPHQCVHARLRRAMGFAHPAIATSTKSQDR